jgi:hypothetical protein
MSGTTLIPASLRGNTKCPKSSSLGVNVAPTAVLISIQFSVSYFFVIRDSFNKMIYIKRHNYHYPRHYLTIVSDSADTTYAEYK